MTNIINQEQLIIIKNNDLNKYLKKLEHDLNITSHKQIL